jgi:AraC family transcriptional regulator
MGHHRVRQRLRFGEYYGVATLRRTVGPLRVWRFEHLPNCQIPSHRHERAHVICVLKGSFVDTDASGTTACRQGDAMLYPRDATHATVMGQEGSVTVVVEFEADELPRLLPDSFMQLGRAHVLRGCDLEPLAQAADGTQVEIENAVRTLLAGLPRVGGEPAWVASVKAALDRRPVLEPDVGELAKIAGRHKAHLMRAFRQHVGVTVGEYARARLVARAGEELRRGERALSDIAVSYGFADQSHFARTFKRFMNMTPDAYRKAADASGGG